MTIEELLVRYGQNMNKMGKKANQEPSKRCEDVEKTHADKGINGEVESGASEADSNGKEKAAGAGNAAEGSKMRACRRVAAASGGSSSSSSNKPGSTGDAGPSCSSSAAPAPGSAKSKFFEDSEESEEGEEEEEGSDEEVRLEDLSLNVLRFMFQRSRFFHLQKLLTLNLTSGVICLTRPIGLQRGGW